MTAEIVHTVDTPALLGSRLESISAQLRDALTVGLKDLDCLDVVSRQADAACAIGVMVRLRSTLETLSAEMQAVLDAQGEVFGLDKLSVAVSKAVVRRISEGSGYAEIKDELMEAFDRFCLPVFLRRSGGNIMAAARGADIDVKHFKRAMRACGITALNYDAFNARTPEEDKIFERTLRDNRHFFGDMGYKEAKDVVERIFQSTLVKNLLLRHGGNLVQAARAAQVDRKYFRALMKKFGITARGEEKEI